MPTYVYKCDDCEHTFEARQRFSDEPLSECPACETGNVRRVINNVGIVFKGSGFYITDSRNGKNGHIASENGRSEKAAEPTADDKKGEKTEGTKKAEKPVVKKTEKADEK